VLARKGSTVVEWHCARSGGGTAFGTPRELAGHVERLLADTARATEMGERGRAYVLENYQWPHVLDLIEADLFSLKANSR
jgi:glycosyltransferase involved in cell wall biosynthesis